MMDLFNSLEPLQKFFWVIALCASLVFLIQTIMTFVGLPYFSSILRALSPSLTPA